MDQQIINWVLGALGGLIGFLLHILLKSVEDLHNNERELSNKINEIEIQMAGSYICKTDFNKTMDRVFAKLDRIEEKLNEKMDK